MVKAIKSDWRTAEIPERQKAMLAYSEKLTLTPAEMTEADVAALREHGFSDEQILAVLMVAGFFNFATRIADGLGIVLDRQHIPGTPEYEAVMNRETD